MSSAISMNIADELLILVKEVAIQELIIAMVVAVAVVAVKITMDIHKIYTDILTSYNVLTVFKGDVDKEDLKIIISLFLLSYTNLSIINRDRSLKKDEKVENFFNALDKIIDKRFVKDILDKETLESIVLDFNKRIKYMKEHGLDIEVYEEMKTPGVDSIKYIIE